MASSAPDTEVEKTAGTRPTAELPGKPTLQTSESRGLQIGQEISQLENLLRSVFSGISDRTNWTGDCQWR